MKPIGPPNTFEGVNLRPLVIVLLSAWAVIMAVLIVVSAVL